MGRKGYLPGIEARLFSEECYSYDDIMQIMGKLKEVDELRKEKNAVILAHFYQVPPIQMIADVLGDSLKLAQASREIEDKDLIVSSTVHFMAEMVKLLSPHKKVVTPSLEAGCSIAEGMNKETILKIRDEFPDASIVTYINTGAGVKSVSDVVCTSANAREIVQRVGGSPVIMLPDYNLAVNVLSGLSDKSGKDFLAYKGWEDGEIVLEDIASREEIRIEAGDTRLPVLDNGKCYVHEQFTAEGTRGDRVRYAIDLVLAHPEVSEEVAAAADFVGSTGKMIAHVAENPGANRFLVLTECDLISPLREAYPDKKFITPCYICKYMKRNDLDGLLNSLRNEVHEVVLDKETEVGARKSLDRMFELMNAR